MSSPAVPVREALANSKCKFGAGALIASALNSFRKTSSGKEEKAMARKYYVRVYKIDHTAQKVFAIE
jgi:hypothetical protein